MKKCLFIFSVACAGVASAQEASVAPETPVVPPVVPAEEMASEPLLKGVASEGVSLEVPVPQKTPLADPTLLSVDVAIPEVDAPLVPLVNEEVNTPLAPDVAAPVNVPAVEAEKEAVEAQLREHITLAEGFFKRKFYADAAPEFKVLLEKTKDSPQLQIDFRLRLAECYAKLGRLAEAKEAYLMVAAAPAGDHRATARLRLAKIFREEGKLMEAIPFLTTVIDDTKCVDMLKSAASLELAQIFAEQDNYDDAVKQYKTIITSYPENEIVAKKALTRLYEKMGDYETAITLCEALMKQSNMTEIDKREVAVFAFTIAFQREDFARAVIFTKQQEKSYFPRLPVAWTLLKVGRPEEAKQWLADEKVASPKTTPERLALESAICEALQDQNGALTACERLLVEFPNASESNAAAATMLLIRARRGELKSFLDSYIRVQGRLSNDTHKALAPYRLDAALREGDEVSARAAANLLMNHGTPEQASDARYRLAWMLQERGDYVAAGEMYLETAQKWSTMPIAGRAAYAAACVYSRAGMPDRVKLALEKALMTTDEAIVTSALLLRARIDLAEKNFAAASNSLDEYLRRFPEAKDVPEASYLRGLIFFQNKDFAPAEQAFEKAYTLGVEEKTPYKLLPHERRIDAILRRSQALHALGRGNDAAELLQPIIETNDAKKLAPAYLNWLAEFRLTRKEWKFAERSAHTMVERTAEGSSDRLAAYVLLGRAHEGLGNKDSALAAYRSALEIRSNTLTTRHIDAYLGAGRMYVAIGEHQKALEVFTEVTKLANQDTAQGRLSLAEAYYGIVTSNKALKRNDEALRTSMRLIILFDKNNQFVEKAYVDAIAILESRGEADKAKAKTLREEYKAKYQKDI